MTRAENGAHIEDVIAGVDAGHCMASREPTEETRENGRRILRGDMSADTAVSEAISKHQDAARPASDA